MSKTRTHQIRCPFCGQTQEATLYDTLTVDDPGQKDELLAGRVNRVTCQGCGKSFRIAKPLLYQDRDAGIFILYDPLVGGRTLEEAEQTFLAARKELERLVPPDVMAPELHLVVEWEELVERIFSEGEGLDARLLEHVKYMMYQQNPARLPAALKGLLFDAQDSTAEQLCFVVQDLKTRKLEAVLNFARKDYDALVNVFDEPSQMDLLLEQFPGPYFNGRLKYLQDTRDEEHGHGEGCGCGGEH